VSPAATPHADLATDPFARVAALPGVDEAVTAARTAVDALLRHRVLRRRSAEVTAEASLRSARASAALEGHDVGLDALRARLTAADEAPGAPGGDLGVTLGAVRLYAELGSLTASWERAPRQALARMHTLAGRGLVADGELGRPRLAADAADPLGLGRPPGPAELSARLDGLVGLLVQKTSAPAIVVGAVVHGELLALRPFGTLDGLVARAAARLVLVGRGLDPKAVTATEVGHLETAGGAADAYRTAAAGYAHGGVDGLRGWLLHCARAVELGARDSLALCQAIDRS
jgi:Fic family protein